MNINTLLNSYKLEFDDYIEKFFQENISINKNQLSKAMQYSILNGGKRIRPFLVDQIFRIYSKQYKREQAFKLAMCVELVHSYSLVHDDMSIMDNDKLRRGKLSTYAKYGDPLALLSGCAMLNLSIEVLLKVRTDKRWNEALSLLYKHTGQQGMLLGQSLDIKDDNKNIDKIINVHYYKTCSMFKAAILSSAKAFGATNQDIKYLNKYADSLGLLFQIRDDILDYESTEEKLGKSVGKDKKFNKTTIYSLLGSDGAREKLKEYSIEAKKSLMHIKNNNNLIELIDFLQIWKFTELKVQLIIKYILFMKKITICF